AVGRRRAYHTQKDILFCRSGIGRTGYNPRGSVPVLDQCLHVSRGYRVVKEVAGTPAVRRGGACHAIQVVALRNEGIGRVNDNPGSSVPALDKRLISADTAVV